MMTSRTTIGTIGCVLAGAVCAEPGTLSSGAAANPLEAPPAVTSEWQPGGADPDSSLAYADPGWPLTEKRRTMVDQSLAGMRFRPESGWTAEENTPSRSRGFHVSSSPALSFSFVEQYAGIDLRTFLSAERWLASGTDSAQLVTVGHAWSRVSVEGSAFSSGRVPQPPGSMDLARIDSRAARLSFHPSSNWVVRLSRGTISGLDHLVAGDGLRRTAVSASYRTSFQSGELETTVAWGRTSRRFRESTMGFMAESVYRFDGVHLLFGRIERVGSDDLSRENESLERQMFKMNKLTFGYSRELDLGTAFKVDAGAFVSRHLVPSDRSGLYGNAPTAYMMFVRFRLK